MPSCVMYNCKSRYGNPGLEYSLFSFPNENRKEREIWIRFVQADRRHEEWLPSAATKLCSKHFRREDITYGPTGRPALRKGAVPYPIYIVSSLLSRSPSQGCL
ncbi:hypothetical protein PYW08_012727 [Mythimna loreyi]|uniref:Uncharacterized protein n=1 Tax=Mythimna loreyi TaxID=667449 RepID=A0ACC2Q2V0_9NEOP|nr:hypothetical protein PYW08_012727 [Mythimna loreyi]